VSLKPETRYINSVHRQLKKITRNVSIEAFGSGGGVADRWYDGPASDLWVEYKYVNKFPKLYTPNLTKQQIYWLSKRVENGRRVLVICGSAKGALILSNRAWENPIKIFSDDFDSTKEVARYIIHVCTQHRVNAFKHH
jgi:hypothetical protein